MLRALEALDIQGVACLECDEIYGQLAEEVRADGEAAQDVLLEHWLKQSVCETSIGLAVFATRIRPHKGLAKLRQMDITVCEVVLVECEQGEWEARLRGPRGQPELANAQMESWAAYMRGQSMHLGWREITLHTNRFPIH